MVVVMVVASIVAADVTVAVSGTMVVTLPMKEFVVDRVVANLPVKEFMVDVVVDVAVAVEVAV